MAVSAKILEVLRAEQHEQNPHKAARLWDETLALTEEHHLDPWTYEVINTKWRYLGMLKRAGRTTRAIDLGEQLCDDARKYLEANWTK